MGSALFLLHCGHGGSQPGSDGGQSLDLDREVLGPLQPEQSFEGLPDDPMLPDQGNIREAWRIEVGDRAVVVAVVDTGIDWRHPDLQSAIWINAGEDLDGDGRATSGDLNGVDDDGNGYVDDIIGWDFVQDDNDPMDTYGHGTSVSGVVTAATGNGVGVAGHTWNCPIMPIRVRSTLATDYRRVAQGIRYAVENGARVVNLSLGGLQPPDPSLKDAIAAAYGAGVLIVGSAGNQDSDRLHYPDAYDEVMSVAAVDAGGTKTTSSNYGETVEVSAQTGNMTTTLGGGYDSAGGTSHATPCVSALGALLFSHSPQLTNDEVRDIIGATADSVDTMNPEHVGLLGAGRINFLAALESGG